MNSDIATYCFLWFFFSISQPLQILNLYWILWQSGYKDIFFLSQSYQNNQNLLYINHLDILIFSTLNNSMLPIMTLLSKWKVSIYPYYHYIPYKAALSYISIDIHAFHTIRVIKITIHSDGTYITEIMCFLLRYDYLYVRKTIQACSHYCNELLSTLDIN